MFDRDSDRVRQIRTSGLCTVSCLFVCVCVRTRAKTFTNMSESYQNTNFLADASSGKVSGGMIDEDKLYESSRTDSGFLSGGNLVLSGEILSEEIIPEHEHRGHSGNDLKTPETQQSLMRLDSGVDVGITESFSTLSLKNPGLNDLNTKTAVQQQPEQHQQQQQQRQLPWEEYYGQDEDGDT